MHAYVHSGAASAVEAAAAKREAKRAALEAEGLLPEEIAEILDDEDAEYGCRGQTWMWRVGRREPGRDSCGALPNERKAHGNIAGEGTSLPFGTPNSYLLRRYDRRLQKRFPHLTRNWERSVFSQAAFNFGRARGPLSTRHPQSPVRHVRGAGPRRLRPQEGRPLILWELKLVIEFPPGALILIPSTTITHSNLPVGPAEHRASFTQYTGGGLFRYVDNGFRTERELTEEDPDEYARVCEQKAGRWEMGLGLLSTSMNC
ncbi:hypothetical protein B0H14DRAFT_3529964 [Mycena olivaceomarginata]|nr:hypothetical protein B0H14DRAFT_3529964 [Mycena olivaceomarginata]